MSGLSNRLQARGPSLGKVIAAVVVGAVYLFLAQPTLGSMIAYPLALAILWGAWQAENRRPRDGWWKLGGLAAAMMVLLAGKGWRQGTTLLEFTYGIPWQLLAFTAVTIFIFALFALGLNLEFGFGGIINFGHIAFMSIGAYVVALLTAQAGFWATQTGILLSLLLAVTAAALAGLLLALPAIRLREDYLAIVTIAAAEILQRFLNNETQWTGGPQGVVIASEARPFTLSWIETVPLVGGPLNNLLEGLASMLGFRGSPYLFILFALALGGTILVVWLSERLVDSPWGRVIQAVREDEDAARTLGINPTIYKLQAFAIGSAVAALAGALFAWQVAFVVPNQFLAPKTFWAWIMVVIGGVGNNKGAVAGAFIFLTINELTTNVAQLRQIGFDSEQVAAFATLALGALLIGFMLFKPEGLFGDKEELELVE